MRTTTTTTGPTADGPTLGLVGYLRADDRATAAPLETALRDYAVRTGLGPLIGVHHDPAAPGARAVNGYQRCLADLAAGRAHAIVTPTREHLAADPTSRAVLIAQADALGGVVHIIDPRPAGHAGWPEASDPALAPARRPLDVLAGTSAGTTRTRRQPRREAGVLSRIA